MSKLPATISTILESSINRYTALDPMAPAAIAALNGKAIALQLREFSFPIYFFIDDNRIKVLSELEDTTNVQLKTSLPSLVRMTLSSDSDESVLGGEIDMSGDMEVGRQFRDIFRNLDIDWEEIISKYTGDIVAHKLGNGVRELKSWLDNTGKTLQSDIGEFLQEESRQLPTNLEVNTFIENVNTVRLSVDRAEVRLKHIRQTLEQLQPGQAKENKQ